MPFLKTFLLLLALQFVLVLPSPGQSPSPTQQVATATPAATVTPSEEIRILTKEVENQKYYNDKIVGSFATLIQTAVGVFALFLAGAIINGIVQRLSDRKILRDEIDARHEKMISDYESKATALKYEYDAKFKEFSVQITASTEEAVKKVVNEVTMLDHQMTLDDAQRLKAEGNYTDALISLSACVALAIRMRIYSLIQSDLILIGTLLDDSPLTGLAEGVLQQVLENFKGMPFQIGPKRKQVMDKLQKLAPADYTFPRQWGN